MAEKVKKTIPWFIILALIGFTVFAGFSLRTPEIKADTASTSVTVGNTVPAFNGGEEPYEDPSSHSGTGTGGTAGNPNGD